jgi:predicted RNA-binding Zn-ribbon protein involved in translation (DUF1610 family)
MDWTIFTILVSVLLLVVICVPFVVGGLLNRGKRLKCPDCDFAFIAPVADEKMLGYGVSPPYMGAVRCPNCGNKRWRRNYSRVECQANSV